MKALIDTCVVIDFLQKREPFAPSAKKIFYGMAADSFSGYITSKAITDIYYLIHRCTHSDKESREKINQLLSLIGLIDTTAEDIFHALASDISDFEDAVMVFSAVRADMDCIVTRNIKDYLKASIAVYTPEQFLNMLEDEKPS